MALELGGLFDTDSVHSNDEDIVQQCISAFKRGDEKESFRLLSLLEDPTEVTDENGATFLHLAAKNGWTDMIGKGLNLTEDELLLYLRKKDCNGKTPLQYASANKHWNDMALLLMVGLFGGNDRDGPNFSKAPQLFKECLPGTFLPYNYCYED